MNSGITFFTTFKGFDDTTDSIGQQSAVYSWVREEFTSNPVLAIGDDVGVTEFCTKHKLTLIPEVERARDHGLVSAHPMLRSLFSTAIAHTKTKYMCLMNSDIIVSPSFHTGLGHLLFAHEQPFVTGVRYNINLAAPVITEEGYAALWKSTKAVIHGGGGSDYFAFSVELAKKLLEVMPDYVLGAAAWDNWLHWAALTYSVSPICTIKHLKILHPAHVYRQLSLNVKNTIYEHPAVQHNLKIYKSSTQRASTSGGRWKYL